MQEFAEQLERWKASLPRQIDVGSLLSRCNIAHKWKAPFRCLVAREGLLWRMTDLGEQIICLTDNNHYLGARILLRNALENLGILCYITHKIESVVGGQLDFFEFDDLSKQLIMGSRDGSTAITAVNVLTALGKAERKYPGLLEMYKRLSESAHPNFDGILMGYTATNPKEFETTFQNNWQSIFGAQQLPATLLVYHAFESTYNLDLIAAIEELEEWLRKNDQHLESRRGGTLPAWAVSGSSSMAKSSCST